MTKNICIYNYHTNINIKIVTIIAIYDFSYALFSLSLLCPSHSFIITQIHIELVGTYIP